MTHNVQQFTVVDPRGMDGDCYEVGARALAQLRGIVRLAELSLAPVELMVRNAELERQMYGGEEPDVDTWLSGPQRAQLVKIQTELQNVQRRLSVLERAASYDPKHPPRA